MRLRDIIRDGLPHRGLSAEVNEWRRSNLRNLWRGIRDLYTPRLGVGGAAVGVGALYLRKGQLQYDRNGELIVDELGQPILAGAVDFGLASLRVVTTVGVGFIVDAFQNIVEVETMKYHGIGTGTNAEASADTALQTELTTQYNPNSTRATGTTTEGASANTYRTVGTNTPDASVAITEHGIFSDPTVASGVLLDRSVFSAVNLNGTGDSLETTYELTLPAGS